MRLYSENKVVYFMTKGLSKWETGLLCYLPSSFPSASPWFLQ